MSAKQYLETLIHDLQNLQQDVKEQFKDLNEKQFNWKPSEKQWSIAECFTHLMLTSEAYQPQIKKKFADFGTLPKDEGKPNKTTIGGQLMMNMVNPHKKKISKIPAPKLFRPTQSQYQLSLIEDFLAHLQKLAQFMKDCSMLNLNKIYIHSPALSLLQFNLAEYCQLEVFHQIRHFQQAMRVMQQDLFPKA